MANKWIDIKPTREERRRTHRLAEFERRYEMIMPIDATGAETQCRDKFLQQLFDGMKFDDIDDKDSDLDEEIPRYSNRLSLVKFLESHRRILRTTHKLEDFKTWILDPRHFSVMTGQTNHYKELLESMKLSSLSYLFTRVIERLSAMHSITLEWVNMEAIDLEHGLFKWSMKAFFERCKLNDPVYLDVLMRNYSENLLDWVKFSEDLNEMQRYFRYFQMEMYDEKNHNQLKTIIWDQEQLINIGDEMDQMLIKSLKRFKTIEDQLREVANTLECRKMKMKIRECYHESREALIRLPMEWRYVRDYYHSIVDVEEHKDNVPLLELKKQVKELRQLMLDHEQTNFQSSCIYKLTINNYEQRLAEFTNKLNEESVYWDNRIQVTKGQLAKARLDFEETEKKITYMRSRVEQVRELQRQQHEQALEALNRAANQAENNLSISSRRQKSRLPRSSEKQIKRTKKTKKT